MLGIASLVLAVFVGLSFRQWEQYRRANREAERSREILLAIDTIQASLVNAETGQRGFLLTGESRYLEPYNRALAQLPNDLANLRRLLSEGQRRTQNFDQLNALAGRKVDELRHTIEAQRTQGAQAALAIVLTDEGRQTMDAIRALCAQMQRDENARQARASAGGEAAAGIALLIMVAGSLVLLFFFAFGFEPFASPDPQAWQRPWLLRYGAAILGVVAVSLIRMALTPLMGPIAMPFTLYFCAVAFAAWYGGFRPAVLSIALSLLAGAWFFAAPTRSLWVSGHDDQVAMLMMVLVGFGIALLSRSQRSAVDRALRAENSERSQRERLGMALAAGKMGVFEVHPGKNTFWWSPETYLLFGLNPAEFMPARDSFIALVHPEDRERFMHNWDESIAERQPLNQSFRTLTAEGKERWISCRGTPEWDESGLAVHYSGIFLDITGRKEAENVLREFEKLAAAARLSAAIAHEINNPLSAVTNLVYLAKGTPGVPRSAAEQLTLAEQELERVGHATRQALGFYRESSRTERIDIQELIESVLKIFWTKIAEKKITVLRNFLKCAPVYGVRGEIRQVVSNLLANAIDAVSEGGAITVGIRPADEEGAIEIMVADDGHGIAAEHLDHIFEPFFTTRTRTKTGLGLWVAKQIVERHQGTIELRPQDIPGRSGATFIVSLPVGPGTRASGQPIGSRESAAGADEDLSRKLV
jgi:PAS domain S-box-containing protein